MTTPTPREARRCYHALHPVYAAYYFAPEHDIACRHGPGNAGGADSSWTALLPSMIVTGIGMGLFNPPRAAVTIGVVPPEKAGMASGIGETFLQVGVAVGIAAFGALLHRRVTDAFAASDAGGQLGHRAHEVGTAVAAEGQGQAVADVPTDLADPVAEAAKSAFVSGLTDVVALCAAVCALGPEAATVPA